jgi:TDG/mug DNA glycosylase family protein
MAKGRFTRAELAAYHGAHVDDFVPPNLRLLVVGINPGLWTAAANAHFARPGNRFWPALHRAGITREQMDMSAGMSAADRAELSALGIGITNLVPEATARADEVTAAQLAPARGRLAELVRVHQPRVVVVLGKTAYRQAFGVRRVEAGRQPDDLEGAELWVLPNPSGLNAHDTVETLAAAYREAAEAAGLVLVSRSGTLSSGQPDETTEDSDR